MRWRSPGTAHGLFLLAWTLLTGYMTIAAIRVSGAVAAVFVALFLTFLLLTIGERAGAAGIGVAGGIPGIITAVLARYASCAGVVNATWERPVLPVWAVS